MSRCHQPPKRVCSPPALLLGMWRPHHPTVPTIIPTVPSPLAHPHCHRGTLMGAPSHSPHGFAGIASPPAPAPAARGMGQVRGISGWDSPQGSRHWRDMFQKPPAFMPALLRHLVPSLQSELLPHSSTPPTSSSHSLYFNLLATSRAVSPAAFTAQGTKGGQIQVAALPLPPKKPKIPIPSSYLW